MQQPYEFGPFRLDPEPAVLWREGAIVPLAPKALALLRALVERAGEVVATRQLMASVWPDAHVQAANLSVTVAALRKALGDQTNGRSWIQTVSRRGYRFDAELLGHRAGSQVSLAVLPFQALGADADAHLGLALADAIIARLTAAEVLRVCPTGTIAGYVVAPRPPLAAAEELGVDAVVDGTLQRDGSRVRVSVQLVPRTGKVRPWAGRFDGEAGDLFSLQDEVAEQVVAAVTPKLPAAARRTAAARHVPRPGAFEAYLRGRYFLARFDLEGVAKAFGSFGEAASLDPEYAEPRAGLASAHLLRGFTGPDPPARAWDIAAECAAQALERDPASAEAHVALAFVALFRDWAWVQARRELDEAVALRPGAPGARLWLGFLLCAQGQPEAARREIAHAREADPLSPVGAVVTSVLLEVEGDLAGARLLALRAAELHPARFLGHWRVGVVAQRAGKPAEAVAPLRRALALTHGGAVVKCGLARALAASGEPDEARALLAEVERESLLSFVSPTQRALTERALGQPAARIAELLAAAAEARDPWLTFMRADRGALGTGRAARELLDRVLG